MGRDEGWMAVVWSLFDYWKGEKSGCIVGPRGLLSRHCRALGLRSLSLALYYPSTRFSSFNDSVSHPSASWRTCLRFLTCVLRMSSHSACEASAATTGGDNSSTRSARGRVGALVLDARGLDDGADACMGVMGARL